MMAVVPIAESDLIWVRAVNHRNQRTAECINYRVRLARLRHSNNVGPPKLRSGIHPQTVRSESCMKDELRGLVAYDE